MGPHVGEEVESGPSAFGPCCLVVLVLDRRMIMGAFVFDGFSSLGSSQTSKKQTTRVLVEWLGATGEILQISLGIDSIMLIVLQQSGRGGQGSLTTSPANLSIPQLSMALS